MLEPVSAWRQHVKDFDFLNGCLGITVCFLEPELFAYYLFPAAFSLKRLLRKCQATIKYIFFGRSKLFEKFRKAKSQLHRHPILVCCMLGVGCGFQQKFFEISQNYFSDHKTKQKTTFKLFY